MNFQFHNEILKAILPCLSLSIIHQYFIDRSLILVYDSGVSELH